ncbi:MAG: D-alanyl-D-alanine carboxypeptidase, partial [Actinomycetota bacterium]|nr:D-alanyl-D-alanine carboxypeptidase [Actinomycetota bacterium]
MRRLALSAAVIIVPALALLALWRVADGRRGASEPLDLRPDAVQDTGRPVTEPLRTRLLSFRRTPALLADDSNRAQLAAAVRALSSRVGERSCLTVSLDGMDVQRVGPDRPVVPASSMKVIVAAVALERLGRDHRFTTTLVGTVDG